MNGGISSIGACCACRIGYVSPIGTCSCGCHKPKVKTKLDKAREQYASVVDGMALLSLFVDGKPHRVENTSDLRSLVCAGLVTTLKPSVRLKYAGRQIQCVITRQGRETWESLSDFWSWMEEA